MLTYPNIDPIIFSIGWFQIRWYSLMYIIALVVVAMFFRYSSRKGTLKLSLEQIENIMVYGLVGMILGARITYVFIYNPTYYLGLGGGPAHLSELLAVWKGGLSFHGAMVGIILAVLVFCRRHDRPFLNVTDHIALSVPVGLGFGRIGNFINGELWGRVTDSPLGMVFPDGGPLPRHPSQLYESFGEGVLLLAFMWLIRSFKPHSGILSGCFLLGYGTIRFVIEFFREPDQQLGLVLGPFSMGQILCALMWIVGIIVILYVQNHKDEQPVVWN